MRLEFAFQTLHFVLAGQQSRTLNGTTAGHTAAGIYYLPVQGYNAELIPYLLSQGNGIFQVINNTYTPQQPVNQTAVFIVALDHLRGNSQKSKALFHVIGIDNLAGNGRYRQEGGTASIIILEVVHGRLGIVFGVYHDILNGVA